MKFAKRIRFTLYLLETNTRNSNNVQVKDKLFNLTGELFTMYTYIKTSSYIF